MKVLTAPPSWVSRIQISNDLKNLKKTYFVLISTDKTPVIEGAIEIEIEADEEYEEQIDFTDAGAAMRMQVV